MVWNSPSGRLAYGIDHCTEGVAVFCSGVAVQAHWLANEIFHQGSMNYVTGTTCHASGRNLGTAQLILDDTSHALRLRARSNSLTVVVKSVACSSLEQATNWLQCQEL
jgi:hypothetical protein